MIIEQKDRMIVGVRKPLREKEKKIEKRGFKHG